MRRAVGMSGGEAFENDDLAAPPRQLERGSGADYAGSDHHNVCRVGRLPDAALALFDESALGLP